MNMLILGCIPPGEPLYSFLIVLLSSILRTRLTHFKICILIKEVLLRFSYTAQFLYFYSLTTSHLNSRLIMFLSNSVSNLPNSSTSNLFLGKFPSFTPIYHDWSRPVLVDRLTNIRFCSRSS